MDKLKKYVNMATLTFTLVSSALYALVAGASDAGADSVFILTPGKAFILLLLSLLVGFSFAIFDVKALPQTAKRLIHIAINFVLTVITVISMYNENTTGDKTMLVFISCFVFLAVYFLGMLVCSGLRKLEKFTKDAKN